MILKNYRFDERFALGEAFKALHMYNKVLRFSVDDQYINEELLSTYFLSEDEQERKDCEKKLATAAIRFVYDHPDILFKERNSRLVASQFMEAIRGSAIEYDYHMGRLGEDAIEAERTRSRLLKANSVARKAVLLQKVKTTAKNALAKVKQVATKMTWKTIKHKLKDAVAAGTEVLSQGDLKKDDVRLALEITEQLIPKKVKEKVKHECKALIEKAANVIESSVKALAETPIGKKVTTFMNEKVAPILGRASDAVEKAYGIVQSKLKAGWNRFKSIF